MNINRCSTYERCSTFTSSLACPVEFIFHQSHINFIFSDSTGGEKGADGGCGRTPVPAELSQLSVDTLIPAQQAPEASAL